MGFETNRFVGEVDKDFYCSICLMIIEDPIASHCDHIFCKKCINEWLLNSNTCPVDRKCLRVSQLTQSSRSFRKHYSSLVMKCDFESNGCQNCSKIKDFERHKNECGFNPNAKIKCNKGCNCLVPKTEEQTHDCIQYLKRMFKNKTKELNEIIRVKDINLIELRAEILSLRSIRRHNSASDNIELRHSLANKQVGRVDAIQANSSQTPNNEPTQRHHIFTPHRSSPMTSPAIVAEMASHRASLRSSPYPNVRLSLTKKSNLMIARSEGENANQVNQIPTHTRNREQRIINDRNEHQLQQHHQYLSDITSTPEPTVHSSNQRTNTSTQTSNDN